MSVAYKLEGLNTRQCLAFKNSGVVKTELKLATSSEMHSIGEDRECLIDPCPPLSSF